MMQNETRILEPGTLVDGRYEIISRIGRGGFATVYHSKHLQLDRPAALKILDPITPGTSENFIERFLSEARIVANLRHPNVVMIYDFGVVRESQPYIAMDLLEGHDLETELTNHGSMDPERAKRLFLGVLDALNEGHKKKIVHKDLKPSNLFLVHPRTDKEKLIVLDYGIARIADSDSPRLTQTGGYTGTPAYMPPEYIRESLVSPTNDVYQIALILIEMITGEAVINEKTSVACMVAHLGGMRNIPDWICQSNWGPILEKGLEIEHQDRFQNAGELMNALQNAPVPVYGQVRRTSPENNHNLEKISNQAPIGWGSTQPGLADASDAMLGDVSNYTPYPAIVAPSHTNNQSAPRGQLAPSQPQSLSVPLSQQSGQSHPPKKKKSGLFWAMSLLFFGVPLITLTIFLSVIYGYYGGFTEYFQALGAAVELEDIDDRPRPTIVTKPTYKSLSTKEILTQSLNNKPKADAQKVLFFLQATYVAYSFHNQVEVFDVSVKNHGYGDVSRLALPSKSGELVDMARTTLGYGQSIKGGPKRINTDASAFLENMQNFRTVLEDLTDYYQNKAYEDEPQKAKNLHLAAMRANREVEKSYKVFEHKISIYYKAIFERCHEESKASDAFEAHACTLMLQAWKMRTAITVGKNETKALRGYVRALRALKKSERKNRSILQTRNSYGQHTQFVSSAEDLRDESRSWIERGPPTKWKDLLEQPEAPLFVHMDVNFLLSSYLQFK